MMRITIVVLLVCCGLLPDVVPAAAQENAEPVPRFEPAVCPPPIDTWSNFECGHLIVPEDHAQPDGPTLRLMVAIAHSRSANPAPDPAIMLAGGPGNAAVGADGTSMLEAAILAKRDIVYLDQRGVGRSEPNLSCSELRGYAYDILNDDPRSIEENYLTRVLACRNRLIAEGINLSAYTTNQNAADVAALRIALGYEAWNLFGYSYGTRLALTVMRDHPTGIRSVILDSVYPPNAEPQIESSAIADEMLNTFFAACADDFLCNLLYPDLKKVYYDLFARLNADPAQVLVTNPETGEHIEFTLDGDLLVMGVIQLLSDHAVIPYLPAIIYDFRDGDFSRLDGLLKGLMNEGVLNGMAFTVLCTEEIPFATASQVAAAASAYPEAVRVLDGFMGDLGYRVCDTWLGGAPTTNTIDNAPVVSDIPTLILTGEYDLATPPRWGYLAAETLSQSVAYEFPAVGHIAVLGGACPTGIAVNFLDDPYTPPPSGCIHDMRDLAFVISVKQTRPWARICAGVFGLLAAVLVGRVAWSMGRRPRWIAWRGSLRLVGYLPALFSAAGLVLVLAVGRLSAQDTLRLVEIIVGLAIALQAVYAFSPPDDPPLEALLACPRPAWWVLVERLLLIFAMQSIIALIGAIATLIITDDHNVLLALTRWISPALMLAGIAVYTSIRSRVAVFGAALSLLIWFTLVMVGDALLPDTQVLFPLNYIKPWLWPFQPYLKPESLTLSDYILNRIVVGAAGIGLVALAAYQLRDEESALFSQSKKSNEAA